MNDDTASTKKPFDSARDQRAHDLLYVSDATRERIEKIHEEAERERNRMREDQAKTRPDDIAVEKARLLLQKLAPRPTPSGVMNEKDTKRESNDELEQTATRNVDQHNERQVRARYALEGSLTNVVIAEDVRAFEVSRTAQHREEQKPERPSVLDNPRSSDTRGAFHQAARDPDIERER